MNYANERHLKHFFRELDIEYTFKPKEGCEDFSEKMDYVSFCLNTGSLLAMNDNPLEVILNGTKYPRLKKDGAIETNKQSSI